MRNVRTATLNADSVLIVVDACQQPEEVMSMLVDGQQTLVTDNRPTLLVLNKQDLIKPGEITKKKEWYEKNGGATEVMAISAKRGDGVDKVKQWLLGRLPYGPAYYPKDIVSEHPERFFVAEILREKIFIQYRQEIPYVCQVNVTSYMERRVAKDYIQLEIVVEKDGQKGILLGKGGQALKTLATAARLDIEDFVGKEVFVEIKVKVKEDWRENEELLDHYGYSGKMSF